jgi:hypothetical protein
MLYDGADVVQELTGGSPSANLLLGGLDQVLSRTDGSGTRGVLRDALGSTLGPVDGAGWCRRSSHRTGRTDRERVVCRARRGSGAVPVTALTDPSGLRPGVGRELIHIVIIPARTRRVVFRETSMTAPQVTAVDLLEGATSNDTPGVVSSLGRSTSVDICLDL